MNILSFLCHFIMLKVFSYKGPGLHLVYVSSRTSNKTGNGPDALHDAGKESWSASISVVQNSKLYAVQKSKHSWKKMYIFRTPPASQFTAIIYFLLSKLHVFLKKICVAWSSSVRINEHLQCQLNTIQLFPI